MARVGGHWVPLTVDAGRLEHSLGGLVASGYPVRPLLPASEAAPATPSLFRLELPRRSDLSRAFIRWHEPCVGADSPLRNYKDAPFLFFVHNVLCARRVPPWTTVPRAERVRSETRYGTWERLTLCCECDDSNGDLEPPLSTCANLVLTFYLRSGDWPISFDKGCFVRRTSNGGRGPDTAPMAFAFVEALPKSAVAEEKQPLEHALSGAAAKAIAGEPRVQADAPFSLGLVALLVVAVAVEVCPSRVATTGILVLGISALLIALVGVIVSEPRVQAPSQRPITSMTEASLPFVPLPSELPARTAGAGWPETMGKSYRFVPEELRQELAAAAREARAGQAESEHSFRQELHQELKAAARDAEGARAEVEQQLRVELHQELRSAAQRAAGDLAELRQELEVAAQNADSKEAAVKQHWCQELRQELEAVARDASAGQAELHGELETAAHHAELLQAEAEQHCRQALEAAAQETEAGRAEMQQHLCRLRQELEAVAKDAAAGQAELLCEVEAAAQDREARLCQELCQELQAEARIAETGARDIESRMRQEYRDMEAEQQRLIAEANDERERIRAEKDEWQKQQEEYLDDQEQIAEEWEEWYEDKKQEALAELSQRNDSLAEEMRGLCSNSTRDESDKARGQAMQRAQLLETQGRLLALEIAEQNARSEYHGEDAVQIPPLQDEEETRSQASSYDQPDPVVERLIRMGARRVM